MHKKNSIHLNTAIITSAGICLRYYKDLLGEYLYDYGIQQGVPLYGYGRF